MKKNTYLSRRLFLVLGTFIMGSIVWVIFMYNGIYGERGIEQVSVVGISYDSIESLSLLDQIQLLEEIDEYNEKTEYILSEYAKRRDVLGYFANIKLARFYALNNKVEASTYYNQAIGLHETKELKYEYAEFLKFNDMEKASRVLEELLPDMAAIEGLESLGISHEGILDILFTKKQWQPYINYYRQNYGNELEEIELGKKLKFGIALGNLGRYTESLAILEELNNKIGDNGDFKWWFARSLEELGRVNEAKELYKSIGELGSYRLGIILEKEGKIKEAAESYIKSNLNMSRWRGAQILDEMGNSNRALDVYLQIAKEEGVYQDDAAFRAYVLLNKNSSTEAVNMLKILEQYPVWMKRIGKEPLWASRNNVDVKIPEFIKRVDDYKYMGREDLAKIELAIVEKNGNRIEKLALGEWYRSQGNYPMAVTWGIRALREEPCMFAYELAYPRPFEDLVKRWAKEYNVDPYLIWAVMREESHFRDSVHSRVGAIGLMQIMPATGKDIAGRLKITVTNEDILQPDINIRFGAFYIRSMLNMFSDDLDKALAAYNGGGGNVRRWSNSNLGSTATGFPTSITFLETREYITKVGNSYYIYKWLYEDRE